MLRAYFMPCDFYPKILFCGEKQGIQILCDVLTQFLQSKKDLDLQLFNQLQQRNLNLTLKYTNHLDNGVIQVKNSPSFEWYMTFDQASEYQQELRELIDSKQDSGSIYFELLQPNEIKIKVSMGEFDDSYLLN